MRRKFIFIASVLSAGMLLGIVFMPAAGLAWPWDKDKQEITVEGYAFCSGLFDATVTNSGDLASYLSNAFHPRVEWFKIRGRDDNAIIVGGSPERYRYRIKVPEGWGVEWYMKCHGDSEARNGSFKVTSSLIGTHQTRHICSEKVGLSPCIPEEYAGCVLLFVEGGFEPPIGRTFDQALADLAVIERNGYSGPRDATGCLAALAADLPGSGSNRQVTPPQPVKSVAPIEVKPPEPIQPVAPIPQAPARPSTHTTTPPPQPAPHPDPPPKPTITNFQVVVYEQEPGHVGVSYNLAWQQGRDPITCHFFIDGHESFTAQCGNPSSKQFYGISEGDHSFYATASDKYGVYSDPSPTVVRHVPGQPAPQPKGFHVEDDFLGGTWARTDPNNGTWYSKSNRPPNGKYWFDNGLGVGVDCARSAAAYTVKFANGTTQTWTWWLHVTDNTWIPAAAVQESSADGAQGVPTC